MKKQNKIMVCVSPDANTRLNMVASLLVGHGIAMTKGDAKKIIQPTLDHSLHKAYFVAISSYELQSSPISTQKLFELAARGILVVIGSRKLRPEFEPFCEAYYPEDV